MAEQTPLTTASVEIEAGAGAGVAPEHVLDGVLPTASRITSTGGGRKRSPCGFFIGGLGALVLAFGLGAWGITEITWVYEWSFVGKVATAVGAVLVSLAGCMMVPDDSFGSRRKFELRLMNHKFDEDNRQLDDLLLSLPLTAQPSKDLKAARTELSKQEKEEDEAKEKAREARFEKHMQQLKISGATVRELDAAQRPCVFVLDFKGDMAASAVKQLRQQVTMLCQTATRSDEVVVRLESPGGLVSEYGLAAAQLLRLRKAKSPPKLTVCVDCVAASGGYLMAAMADHIAAAPFSIVGSIGVVAVIPNVARLLDEKHIDVLQFTAGKYKRTVTPYTPVEEEHKQKVQEELELMHAAFKATLVENRPKLTGKIDQVATGEAWMAVTSRELFGDVLVDSIETSDELLQTRKQQGFAVIKVKEKKKSKGLLKSLEMLSMSTASLVGNLLPSANALEGAGADGLSRRF